MKSIFFSIVIPTLNEEHYLPKLLNSLAKQTYKDFEVIVVDGGSEDKTAQVVSEFNDTFKPRLLFCQKKHVGAQRNLGAKSTNGRYIVFFDADVIVPSSFLEQMQKNLIQKGIDFASTRCIPDNQNLVDQMVVYIVNVGMWLVSKLGMPFMSGQNIFFKREKFMVLGGFDETVVQAEDHELVQRAKKNHLAGEFFYTPTHRISFRRYDREGRLTVLWKYIYSTIYLIFKGPIRRQLFDYKMGGK